MTAPVYLPDDVHVPNSVAFATEVPKKGASCATCRFLSKDQKNCTNSFYVEHSGMGSKLGRKPKRWCCSGWEEG